MMVFQFKLGDIRRLFRNYMSGKYFSQNVLLIVHRVTMKRLLVWRRFMHVICSVGIALRSKVIILLVKKKQ